jgi:hypothetical protein
MSPGRRSPSRVVAVLLVLGASGCGHRMRASVPIDGRYRLPPSPGPEGRKVEPAVAAKPRPEFEGPPAPDGSATPLIPAAASPPLAPLAAGERSLPPLAQLPIMELHLADFEASDEDTMAVDGDAMAQIDASIHFEWRRPKATRARVRLSAGDPTILALHFDASTWVDRNASRVSIRIGVDIAGMPVSFRLPDVRVRPVSIQGEKGVELTVPLVEGRF